MTKNFLIKIGNFSKFADCITDSVRPVQQYSRHLVGIIKHFFKCHFNTLCHPIFLLYAIIDHFLNFDQFILIKNFIYGKENR